MKKLAVVFLFLCMVMGAKADDIFWVGGNGSWLDQANWSEATPTWYVPGWVEGNPANPDSTWAENANLAYAYIEDGNPQVTWASRPDGVVQRVYVNGGHLEIDADISTWRSYLGNKANSTGTATQISGTHYAGSNMRIGGINGGTGIYNLQGGSLDLTTSYIGDAAGSTGIFNLSGGTLNTMRTTTYLEIGNLGNGQFNQTGGTALLNRPRLGYQAGSSGIYSISGGSLIVDKYMGAYNNSTFTVSGSGSDLIDIQQISFNRAVGANINFVVELDADGSTLVQVGTDAASIYNVGALLDNVIFKVDTLEGFDGQIGDTYDVIWAKNFGIHTTGMSFVNLDSTLFSWAVVNAVDFGYESGELLQLTVIPEPATMLLMSFGSFLFIKRKK